MSPGGTPCFSARVSPLYGGVTFPLPDPMAEALRLAEQAGESGAVPVGAVVVRQGKIVAGAANSRPGAHDPTAHAEILAIRQAALRLGQDRLADCDLWVTLEPCAMCAGAISHARIARLYYGAEDSKGGAIVHGPRFFGQETCHHRPESYGGIGAIEAASLLQRFFAARR